MSKSDRRLQNVIVNPDDLIEGTVKMDGNRKFGYGLDTMRAWSIIQDSDTNFFLERQDLDDVNQEVKMLRGLLRIMMGNLNNYDASENPFEFERLTFIDKVMACKLLDLITRVEEAYESYDLASVYEHVFTFIAKDLTDYYLPLSRQRLRT